MATNKSDLRKFWASAPAGGDIEDPDPSKWTGGWIFGEKPPHKWFNYLLKQTTQAFTHLNERGVLEHDFTTTYLAGAFVWSGGKVYKARVENTNQNVVLPTQWQEQSLPDMPSSRNGYILYYSDSKLFWKDVGDITYADYEGKDESTSASIKFPANNTLGNIPLASEISEGEIVINYKNQTVYTKTPEGTVIALLGGGALTINVTPILSGPASGYEEVPVELTIDNYSDDVTYVLYPPAGATDVSRIADKVYFTPAEVASDTPVQFAITGEHIGVTNVSLQGFHDFTVLNVSLIDDEELVYDDLTMTEFLNLNSTQLADTDTTLESITIDTTNITGASSSADILASTTRLIEGEKMVIDGVDLVAGVVTFVPDGGGVGIDTYEIDTTAVTAGGTPATAYINEHRALSNLSSNTGGDTSAGLHNIQSTLEFSNISDATSSADTLKTLEPIADGDNLVIVLDDNSINEIVASGVTFSTPYYSMDTTATTAGEIPSRTYAVDANPSFEISGGFLEATKVSDTYTFGGDGARNASTTDSVPTMTSNTAPSGLAFGTTFFNASQDYHDAFNDIAGGSGVNYWSATAGTTTGKIGYIFTSAKIVNKITIQNETDNTNSGAMDFTIEGSNNTITGLDGTWDALDTVAGRATVSGATTIHTFVNSTPYLSYRLNITANGGNATYLTVSELELIEAIHLNTVRQHNDVIDLTGSLTVQTRMLFRRAKAKLIELYAMIQKLGV